jgi:MYXO-CTERM domain-containing protein
MLSQGQAKAILNVNIFDDGPNLKVTVTGSIAPGNAGTAAAFPATCGSDGWLAGQYYPNFYNSMLCTGTDKDDPFYAISGPSGFGGNGSIYADSVEGFNFQLFPSSFNPSFSGNLPFKNTYTIDTGYVLGQPFYSSATFNGKSLASEGFTATGLVGTWTIDGTSESINICIGADPCVPAQVPGPLPLLGAGAAFGWSRRLRKRIAAPLSTLPQA